MQSQTFRATGVYASRVSVEGDRRYGLVAHVGCMCIPISGVYEMSGVVKHPAGIELGYSGARGVQHPKGDHGG